MLTHRLMISPQAQLRGRRPDELVADIVEALTEDSDLSDEQMALLQQTVSEGDNHGHNVITPTYGIAQDATLNQAPGGDFLSQYLGCTSCHDPHGDANHYMVRSHINTGGRTGLSHLLEHVVAGGTTSNRTEKEIEQIIDRFGGATNAYTSSSLTCYFIDCPAKDVMTAVDLVANGSVEAGAIVTHVLPLDQAQRAFDLAASKAEIAGFRDKIVAEPRNFIAQPVVHKGEVEILVALQLSLDAINSIMTQREGLQFQATNRLKPIDVL